MSTAFTTYAYPLSSVMTDATTNRTSPTRWSDIINVKDYGATGDGATDDTAAIQKAFDAAYGPVSSPHGNSGVRSNRPVFFPNGTYIVTSPAAVTITGSTNVAGFNRLTVTSSANLKTGYIITISGSTTASMNGSWGVDVIDATHIDVYQNNSRPAFIATSDGTINTSALHLYYVWGAHIFGAGRFSTTIQNNTSGDGCAVISTNGFGYSRVEGIRWQGNTSFDYNWDGTNTGGNGTASQSVTFLDCFFGASEASGYGLKIGAAQAMCSETSVINCYFNSSTTSVAGIVNWNANATQQIIMGGNISGFDRGIWVKVGNIENIIGVSFQNNTTYDINIANGTQSGINVVGCRTESVNFLQPQPAEPCIVLACTQANGTSGKFVGDAGCDVTIMGCYSQNGQVHGSAGLNVVNSEFGRTDWNAWYGHIEEAYSAEPWSVKTGSYKPTAGAESGTVYTNRGAGGTITLTLPSDSNAGRCPVGTKLKYLVETAQVLTVSASGSSTALIYISSNTSTAGGTASSSRVGNYLELVNGSDGGSSAWYATSALGTWVLA